MPEGAKTILCADDSPATLATWIEVLDQFGYRAIATTDPEAVLPILSCVPVDLVLLDYFMPVMDGGAVATAIRERSSVPIIITSNNINEVPAPIKALASAVVPKQQGLTALIRMVHELLMTSR